MVIWGAEFGRTPFCQGDINDKKTVGQDHHPYVFDVGWLSKPTLSWPKTVGLESQPTAGGGVKRGFFYGESDDFAYNPAKDPVHDFQATVLHLLGIDHERLTETNSRATISV